MVMPTELLGQLEPGELVGTAQSVDDADLFEDRKVPVRRALREVRPTAHQLGRRHRSIGGDDRLDQSSAARCVALPGLPKSGGDRRM